MMKMCYRSVLMWALAVLLLKSPLMRVVHAQVNAGEKSGVLTDPQLAQILKTADEGEIDVAHVAMKHAKDPKVRAFAKKMISEHGANETDEKKIAKKASLSFADSDQSKELKKDVKSKISKLESEKKVDFDKAYIDSQIEMHQTLLNNLDTQFIPGTQNADLKSFLQKTREHVKAHLDEATQISAALKT